MENIGKKIILVIEDENQLLQAISEKFTHEGFTVLQATNGVDGLKLALENRPSVILLDIAMPQMDGFTMLHKLREDEWGKFAEVIILTNFDANNNDRLTKVIEEQPSYYLIKANTTLEKILEKVQELLASQEKEVQQILNLQKTENK